METICSRPNPRQKGRSQRQRTELKSAMPLPESPRVNSWKSLSNYEVLEFARNFVSRNNISSRTQVARSNSRLYKELRTRNLFDELGFSLGPTLSSLGDKELISRAKMLMEDGNFVRRSHFKKAHYGIYAELKKRDLVGELGFEQVGTDRSSMSSEELVAQANKLVQEEGLSSVTEFIERHGAVYKALSDRGLHLQLEIKRKYVDWSVVPDSELISVAQEKMLKKGICTPGPFKEEFPGIYKQLRKRGLVGDAGLRPAYRSLRRIPSAELIGQARQFIAKHNISSISKLQDAPGGWQLYSELSGRRLLPAVGLLPKIVNWSRLSDAELALYVNKEVERMQIFTARELREKNQKMYQAIHSRSRKSPGIWTRINLLTRAGLSPKSEDLPDQKSMREWLRKFVRRDGIKSPEELKSRCRMLFSAMERTGMDISQEIVSCRFPVPDPHRGSKDANRVMEENLHLVPIIIKTRNLTRYVSHAEAEQLARISLLKSAFKWDGTRDFREYAMQNSIDTWRGVYNEAGTVYVPPHVRARAEGYSKWLQSNPSGTFEEYAKDNGIPEKEWEFYKKELPKHRGSLYALATGKTKNTEEEGLEALESNPVRLSDASPASPEKPGLYDNPEDALEASQFREGVNALLNFLPKRERKIVSMYFGLNGSAPMQLSEIGKRYGVTKQRISQIILRGLRGISKNPVARRQVQDFL